MRLAPISSENVRNIWPHIEHFIVAACKKGPGNEDPEELRVSCETKRHQLWLLLDANGICGAVITGIYDDGTIRRAEWVAFAGSGNEWQALMPQIEQWAKDNGCKTFRSYGRPGMKKRMPQGYRVKGLIFEKELS